MRTVYYGNEHFVPNSYFVRAKHHDPRQGQRVDGFSAPDDAVRAAETLAADAAFQDVLFIALRGRDALVKVFKGVQWFAEGDLNRQFPNAWSIVADVPAADAPPERPDGPERPLPVAA